MTNYINQLIMDYENLSNQTIKIDRRKSIEKKNRRKEIIGTIIFGILFMTIMIIGSIDMRVM